MKWFTAHTCKVFLKAVLYAVYGGVSAFYTPTFFLLAFNFMHGAVNNPDGEVLVPFGIGVLLAILILDMVIVLKTFMSQSLTAIEKWGLLSLFLIVKFAGIFMMEHNDLLFFVKCILQKFSLNEYFLYRM